MMKMCLIKFFQSFKLAEVVEKRAAMAEQCNHKTNLPNLNYLYAQFIQDASEVRDSDDDDDNEDDNDFVYQEITWMDEKEASQCGQDI